MQTPQPRVARGDDDALVRFDDMRALRQDFMRFMLPHRFAMEEVVTKLTILRDEFTLMHDSNPIENIASRLKSPDSIAEKMQRKGSEPTFSSIRETITDIAGVRVTCSFVSDVYHVFELLTSQSDITVLDVRDYIQEPKPHGYRSLHALIEVPVHLTDGPLPVTVEVQLRTIAMDFWASLEHKIHYKYRGAVPADLADRLRDAADTAHALDGLMLDLHEEVKSLDADGVATLPDDIRRGLSTDEIEPSDALIAQLRRLADGDGRY
ncbi:GTP pyrophosphokinase family protein [Aeromicrobium sp. Leaf350]|uniref:GTP pyrophosphokinase n=1 Tax=Aeromicrobium sp. Leaf350 TaxID=2876565 RepID=UPI001E5FE5F6|nr:GTP pyrophosphokinase family protein [Aeromicrobium sp. Leaf350]